MKLFAVILLSQMFNFNHCFAADVNLISLNEWLSKGKIKALEILENAQMKAPEQSWKKIFSKAYKKLKNAYVYRPKKGENFKGCSSNTMAYTFEDGNEIYICSKVVSGKFYQVNELAQLIIHETAHLIGYGNECSATSIEAYAMRLSSVGIRFKNGYWDYCDM